MSLQHFNGEDIFVNFYFWTPWDGHIGTWCLGHLTDTLVWSYCLLADELYRISNGMVNCTSTYASTKVEKRIQVDVQHILLADFLFIVWVAYRNYCFLKFIVTPAVTFFFRSQDPFHLPSDFVNLFVRNKTETKFCSTRSSNPSSVGYARFKNRV